MISQDRPEISFWNQILPPFQCGGVWFEDNLWLEPIKQWVDTNTTSWWTELSLRVASANKTAADSNFEKIYEILGELDLSSLA